MQKFLYFLMSFLHVLLTHFVRIEFFVYYMMNICDDDSQFLTGDYQKNCTHIDEYSCEYNELI